jgi:nicotinate dehydrogenase subunit B
MMIIERRDLLKAGGALIVSFAFGGLRMADALAFQDPGRKPLDPKDVDSFLAFHADGTITVYTGKVDVGTGLRIAIAQMAAEELGVPAQRISVVDGDTGLCPDQGGTGGSTGLTRGGADVRQAAATARQTLIALAATTLNRPAGDLTIVDGEVRPIAGGAGASIASLIGDKRLAIAVDPKAPLRAPATYTSVGQPLARPDVPAKCTGRHVYVHDFTLPGMLHARVIRPRAAGATLASVDESSVRAIPGVRVVRNGNFLAVVAPDEWAVVRAAAELKATWSDTQSLPGSDGLDRWTRSAAVARDQVIAEARGAAAADGSAKRIAASYFWPFQSHASLGPCCAVADIKDNGGTIWSSSQGTHGLRTNLSKVFGLDPAKVRVVFLDGSGSYGTNGGDHAAADAVLISKTIGRPVRVQWSRQDETAWDPKGPQQLIDIRADIDGAGEIATWQTEMWLPTQTPGARALLAAEAAGIAQDHGQGAGAITQNGDPPYTMKGGAGVVVHWTKETPLQLSNLRAPGKIANVFAVESFTDELAASAGADAIAFRAARLEDPRALDVITRMAERFGWDARPSPRRAASRSGSATGRGMAYMRYKQVENYVAMAMEVDVDPQSGRIAVRRVVCAHDCGLVVNPDALKNQIEGCIVQTLSRALHEEVTFDRARVTSVDWASYPILRATEAPSIEVILIDRRDQPLLGAGEAATAPVAAALANAVFDATGVRLRTVPFTRERVKAAMGSAATEVARAVEN